MRTPRVNALINGEFRFWDYGAGPFTANGRTASLWTMILTGTPGVSVAPGVNANDSATPKFLRSRANLSINVTELDPGENVRVSQLVEEGNRFGRQMMILSMIVSGPDGESFFCAIDGHAKKITTRGPDSAGANLVHVTHRQVIPDIAATTLAVDIFTRPSAAGLFKIHIAQLCLLVTEVDPLPWELRNAAEERALLNRYVYPVSAGNQGVSSTVSLFLGIRFPSPMQATPTYVPRKTAAGAIDTVHLTASTKTTSTGTTGHTATDITPNGCRLALTNGWTGLVNGSAQVLATDEVGVFDADPNPKT